MARLPLPSPESATGATRDIFASLERSLGSVPNMARAMSNSPALLKGYAQFSAALAGGSLPAAAREQIALLAAEKNGCGYCLAAHAAIGGKVGLSAPQIEAARAGEAADRKVAGALAFARAILDSRGGVSDAEVRAARDAGLGNAELAEVVGSVALDVLTNYFNRAFATDLDFPPLRPLSQPVR